MGKCDFIESNGNRDDLIIDYLKNGVMGTKIVPLELLNDELKELIKTSLMLPSYGVVVKLIKTNNISASYGCSMEKAIDVMRISNDQS